MPADPRLPSTQFYVKVTRPDKSIVFVAAKYLTFAGVTIVDPNTATAQNAELYSAPSLSSTVVNNTNAYLVVPASFDFAEIVKTADFLRNYGKVDNSAEPSALQLSVFFSLSQQYGKYDFQRSYNYNDTLPEDKFLRLRSLNSKTSLPLFKVSLRT
jgi:hypothetical protein